MITNEKGACNPSDYTSRPLALTVYRSRTDTVPIKAGAKTWNKLLHLIRPRDVREAKDGVGFSMVALQPGKTRASKNVVAVSALVFDIDGTPLTAIRNNIDGYEWVAYSTHSHTAEDHCYRLIMPLTRDLTRSEFVHLWNSINNTLLNGVADPQCRDIGRFYYLPSCPPSMFSDAFTIHNEGTWLGPDAALADLADRAPSGQLEPAPDVTAAAGARSFEHLSKAERSRIFDAVRYLATAQLNGRPGIDQYSVWLRVGMALHESCERKDKALVAWKELSQQSAIWRADPVRAAAECEAKWRTFGNYAGPPVTLDSLVYEARQQGWTPPTRDVVTVPPRFKLKTIDEALREPAPRWLVRGLLQERKLAVMFGSANAGKSFLALDVGLAIARGSDWFGRKTQAGIVVYLAIEGAQRNRLDAYVTYHQLTQMPAGFRIIDVPLNLRDRPSNNVNAGARTDAEVLIEQIRAQLGDAPVSMVIVDTLNQAIQGGDENSSVDMGAFIANANAICAALGCAVLVIHHAGKDQQKGARGHSSLKAAVDTEIEVTYDKTYGVRTASITKQRDGPDDKQIHYILRRVDIGPDPDDPNEQITSCVVTPVPLAVPLPTRGAKAPTGRNQKPTWEKFRDLMTSSPVAVAQGQLGVREGDLVDAVSKALPIKPGTRDRRRQQANEAIEGMRKAGWVEIIETSSGRCVVAGARAGGLGRAPDPMPEMPETPDFARSGNLS